MKIFLKAVPITFLALMSSGYCTAEPLKKVADKLERGMEGQPNKKVAVLGFTYHDGKTSSGSSIVQERLTTYLVQNGKIEVIERNLLNKVMEEMKLGLEGIIESSTTVELGKILGAGAIVTGTLNDLSDKKTEVNARIIQTETGKILAAERTEIERTWKDSPVKPGGGVVKSTIPGGGNYLGKPLVQIAILLDTSNSMDGLINQARAQLWKIVNQFTAAEQKGNSPDIQVALYEYGNDNLPAAEGFVRQVLPFTNDLDAVSQKLFSLTTRGGSEYCGYVLKEAVNGLNWDMHDDVYRAIFIAGNEPFTQGPVDFREADSLASKKGIFVNTIFCGSRQEGMASQWKNGADLASGDYVNIDQQAAVEVAQAPQDDEINKLGADLNKTYIPYGTRGIKAKVIQMEQTDNLKASAPAAMPEMAAARASSQYKGAAASWDAVSAVEQGLTEASDLKKEDLPQELQQMNDRQRTDYIKTQVEERKKIEQKIQDLNFQRQKYISDKQKELAAKGGPQTFGDAVLSSIRSQAAKKGFVFKER